VSGSLEDSRVEAKFSVENISNEFVTYYWCLNVGDNVPPNWSFAVWDQVLSLDNFYGNQCSFCDNVDFLNQLDSMEVYSYFWLNCYPDDIAGSHTVELCLLTECENLETEIICTDVTFNITDGTDVYNAAISEDKVLYPNPTKSEFRILNDSDIASIELYNSSGEFLKREVHEKNEVHLVNTVGIYYVIMRNGSGESVGIEKVIIH